MKKKVWVTRDENNCEETIDLWAENRKPIKRQGDDGIEFFKEKTKIISIPEKTFKQLFGYMPRKKSIQLKILTCSLE